MRDSYYLDLKSLQAVSEAMLLLSRVGKGNENVGLMHGVQFLILRCRTDCFIPSIGAGDLVVAWNLHHSSLSLVPLIAFAFSGREREAQNYQLYVLRYISMLLGIFCDQLSSWWHIVCWKLHQVMLI